MKELTIFLATTCITLSLSAQDDGVQDLDIDELVAVDLNKSSLPIDVDSVKALSGSTINLGMLLPMSTLGGFSEEMIRAAQLAVDEINASGKIMDKELFLIPADEASEVAIAVDKAKQLIKHYNVSGIIGPTTSSSFIKIVNDVLPENPVLAISPTATSIEITELNDNDLAFRTAASDALQGKTAAIFSANNLGRKTAAIFYVDDVYGRGLAQEFKSNFINSGGKIVGEDRYSPLVNLEDYDVTPRLSKILESKPEVLYLISTLVGIINISHQIESAHLFESYKPVIIGSDAVRSDQVMKNANIMALEGMYCTSFKSIQGTSFEQKFHTRYGVKPKSEETADAYDIVYLFALAMLEAQSTDAKILSRHLRSISSTGKKLTAKDIVEIRQLIEKGDDIDYEGLNSSLNFDLHGDVPDREYQIWQIVNGEFVRGVAHVNIK
ncbi:hypothetical protein C900_01422 [Fulvivirga imtechensis AK7]|uniref:Leucine-binding protein domain-containing protein n=1 Tax=Fulvivirga imtechensis AK7 TaxID=1237149 RepID=L8K2X8_9BACT|nr:ABC transporter substrate-binding protein [Fulvivirga imtechensis]ELR73812.1 hypothetical protein C900_01422 [Fulvivirga imtechensis AK7]